MTATLFANNASTTLGGSVSPTATTMTVASGTGSQFPAISSGQYFMATLFASSTGMPNEIVKVTARVGDTMTVVRGQEGSTAQSWSVGDHFENFVTAGFLNSLVDGSSLQTQSGNYATDSGTANAGVITLVPAPANLAALVGVPIRVKKAGGASTGAYALNVNAFGAIPVLIGGQPLEGGELVANEIYEVNYDGTQFNLISNPGTLHGDRLSANSVLNAALAQMAAGTIKGNLGAGSATPYDVSIVDLFTAIGLTSIQSDANGYWFNVGSTIIQFGYKAGTNANFTFPTPFITATPPVVIASNANSMGTLVDAAFAYPISKTQFFMATKASNTGNITGFPCYWLAIGN